MRNFFSFLLFFSILLISNMTGLAAQSKSIFAVEPAGEGDFYNVTVEPSSIDLKAYINQTFELIRQKNDRILEFNNTTKKNLSDLNKDAKDSIDGKKNEIRDFLGLEKDKSKDVSAASQERELHEMPDSENPKLAEDEKNLKKSEIKKIEDENAAIPRRQKFISYCLDNLCGYPYVSGGASPKTGFDCSGLVQYAARESLGIKLPRTAQAMYKSSTKISSDEVLPGDLIFFKAGGKISHVGVYLGIDESDDTFKGKVIFFNSASEPKYRSGTIISSLSEPYWKRHFFGYGKFIE